MNAILQMIDFNFVNLIITILLGIVIPLAILVIKLWASAEDYKKFKASVLARQEKEDEERKKEVLQRHQDSMAISLQLNSIEHKLNTLSINTQK